MCMCTQSGNSQNMLLCLYFIIRDMNSATMHVTLRACQSRLEVQNAVIRIKHGILKFWKQASTTYSWSRFSRAYMSYRLRFCSAIDKENMTLSFTSRQRRAQPRLPGIHWDRALQFRSNLLSPTCILVERFPRALFKRPEAMATRDDYMTSSSSCSNGTHKRLLQETSDYAQDQAMKKVRVSTRTKYTYAPYHDGYEWRKYGQKMIRSSTYPRCYYRCTYHQDHGCPATKHVEQTNSQDPPLFRVVYTNEHSCISTDASSIHIQQMADASLRKAQPELQPSSLMTRRSAGHGEVIKEEEGAIIVSSLGVINGGCRDVTTTSVGMRDMNAAALLSSRYSVLLSSSTVSRSSHEEASPSVSPVLLPTSDKPEMDFVEPLESHWFEPLDLGWFIESTRTD